jgi:hypothetical protein
MITKRHLALLSAVPRPAVAWPLFSHLMMFSVVEAGNQPFPLPVEYLTKETGLDRPAQQRSLRDLAKTGIVRTTREDRYGLPIIYIPGTTKTKHRTP